MMINVFCFLFWEVEQAIAEHASCVNELLYYVKKIGIILTHQNRVYIISTPYLATVVSHYGIKQLKLVSLRILW